MGKACSALTSTVSRHPNAVQRIYARLMRQPRCMSASQRSEQAPALARLVKGPALSITPTPKLNPVPGSAQTTLGGHVLLEFRVPGNGSALHQTVQPSRHHLLKAALLFLFFQAWPRRAARSEAVEAAPLLTSLFPCVELSTVIKMTQRRSGGGVGAVNAMICWFPTKPKRERLGKRLLRPRERNPAGFCWQLVMVQNPAWRPRKGET